ncbi:MAG: hypothetical protein JWQ04_3199 [Pedosphaera sp.]|nr:hypothetical protein [Pedosphaera sp.]
MSELRSGLRKITNGAIGIMPTPVLRYLLKSIHWQPEIQDQIKFHVTPYHYSCALADTDEVDVRGLDTKRVIPGFPEDLSAFFPLIAQLKPFAAELHSLPRTKSENATFWFDNGGYGDFDAITLYAMVRHLKPKRIIEIGSGFSSRLITFAALKNAAEGFKPECMFIEPFPSPALLSFQLSGPLVVKKAQEIPLSEFSNLQSGDILFIDSSHVMKAQSDLCYIFQQILPRVSKGGYLHFHDIFTPYDYPAEWILKHKRSWNEQYVIETLLANGSNFQTILPVHGLWRDHLDKLKELLPSGHICSVALWLRKIQAV